MKIRTGWRLLAALLVLATAGCGYGTIPERQRLMLSARYGELAESVDPATCGTSPVSTARLYPACIAYSKLKDYNRLFQCVACLEENIKAGDRVYLDVDEMARLNPLSDAFADLRSHREQFDIQFDIRESPHLLRAEAFIDLGNYPAAVEAAKRGLAVLPRGSALEVSSEINLLGMLGLACALQGDQACAARALRDLDAVETGGSIGKGPSNRIFKPDQNFAIARIHLARGDYRQALAAMRRDDAAFFRSFVDLASGAALEQASLWTFQQLPKKFMLNKALLETGARAEAKRGFEEMLADPLTRENTGLHWMLLVDRGRIAEEEGELREAIDFYRRGVEVIEWQRSTINTEASKIGFAGDRQQVYQRLVTALFAAGELASAFEYAERAKSRALVDLLAGKQDFGVKGGDAPATRALLLETTAVETALGTQDLTPAREATRGLILTRREKLAEQAPELSSLVSVGALPPARIQGKLEADEVLLEYYTTDRDLFAFILSRSSLNALRLPREGLEDEVERFRALLRDPASAGVTDAARRLYERLLRPLREHLKQPNLVIVPHGTLHYLPFAALADGSAFLVERYGIRTLPSASVLQYLKASRPSAPKAALVFGNPDLGNPRYDLVHAQDEATMVGRTFPGSRVLLRKAATVGAFGSYAGAYPYLHFATHGEFATAAPLKSALLLAPEPGNDGLLTVDRLYAAQLDANLVTLSACNTGLGKTLSGDDMIGLIRGFFYAGTGAVVASLWSVDDQATAYLMTEFYSGLKRTNPRDALRQAQLATKQQYGHPFYWGAFQLSGNGD